MGLLIGIIGAINAGNAARSFSRGEWWIGGVATFAAALCLLACLK